MTAPNRGQERFATLIEPELGLLYRVARSLTPSKADAEDLVQDTMVRAYRNLDRFDGRYPRAWLLTIMRNANINRVRKRKPELFDEPDAVIEGTLLLSTTDGPESNFVDQVFDATIADALAALSEDFRAVVELVDLDGCSYAEAALRLDVPVGTVMSRLHRARTRLRDAISEVGLEAMQP